MVRKLLLAAAALVVLLVVLAVAVGYFLSGDGLRLAIERQASAWLGQPVRVGEASVRVFPRASIRLGQIEVGEPARLVLGRVELSSGLRALLARRVEDARVLVSDSVVDLPLPPGLTGTAPSEEAGPAADVPRTEGGAGSVEIASISRIALRDIRVRSRGRELSISADSSLEGRRLTLQQFVARSGATELEASGDVDLEPRLDARLEIHADRLDLDELVALAGAFAPPPTEGQRSQDRGPAPRVAARLTADTATAGGIEVTSLTADALLDGERLTLEPLAFALFGGRYEGTLDARLGDAMAVTLRSTLEGIDVATLAAFGGSPDSVTGRLSGSGTFRGRGADLAAVLGGASGNGEVAITDGTIRRLNLVRTVVLYFGRPAPDTLEATDAFDRIDATFSLADGVVRADPFSMRSRDAEITGSGTLMLGTQALDGRLRLLLSEELSSQAGRVLQYTREGNRVVLPARIGGTLAEPRVTIDAAAALKSVGSEVQRRLGGVLDRLRGRTEPEP